MKCLSIRQPWAHLIVSGHKDVENRVWRTTHRGPILIHAGRRVARDAAAFYRDQAREADIPWPDQLPTGGVIGVADLMDCADSSDSEWYDPGCVAWLLSNARPMPLLPFKGQLGLFDIPDQTVIDHLRGVDMRYSLASDEDWPTLSAFEQAARMRNWFAEGSYSPALARSDYRHAQQKLLWIRAHRVLAAAIGESVPDLLTTCRAWRLALAS